MDLKKFLPGQDKKEEKEYFWSLVIEPSWVQAGIWRINQGKAQVMSSGPVTAWELDEELVSSADASLSTAIQSFPEELEEPSKTVFAVVPSWVKSGQINEEYLEKIKKLCSELSLKPEGFVVLPEAIAHYIKSEEGSPLNSVVIGIYKDKIEISIFSLGNLLGNTEVSRSVSLSDDIIEGLSRFSETDTLPSRFLIYGGKEGELEDARQELLQLNWEDVGKLKFLHTPKIELISSNEKIIAVCLAGASEMANVTEVEKPQLKEKVLENPPEISEEPEHGEESLQSSLETVSPEKFGFKIGNNFSEGNIPSEHTFTEKSESTERDENFQINSPSIESIANIEPVRESLSNITKPRPKITMPKFSIKGFFSKMSVNRKAVSSGKNVFLFGILFLLVLFIGGFAAWWFLPTASVTIYVSPKKYDESINLTIDPNATNADLGSMLIPGREVKTSASGDKTAQTTGTKVVGEKATGQVTLYRVGPEISLNQGTILSGPNNLQFTLDNNVDVASGSASSPGTTNTSVTASNIGSDYNLASGTSFKIGNYSTNDIEGKNQSDFSGGSSREVSAVSADDQKSLETALTGELTDKAKTDLQSQISNQDIFVDGSLQATPSAKTFSNKVGDEASNLKLSLSLDVTGLSVKKSDITDLVQNIIKDKTPSGFVLRPDQITTNFNLVQKQGSTYKFTATIEANLLPQLNSTEIAKNISGRFPNIAEDYLNKNVPGFVRAAVNIHPNLPSKIDTLPHVSQRIDITFSTEK